MADRDRDNIISPADADRLIAAHDGDVALLCLFLARHPGAGDEHAAAALCRTRAEIASAREKLARLPEAAALSRPVPLPPADEPVEYSAKEIVERLSSTPLVAELARILGATPSRAYLNALVDLTDRLGMPTEVILLLLNHCSDEAQRRWGLQRKPTPKMISEEGYRWANREIMTLELAEEYLRGCARKREEKRRIAELLGIRGRELSPTETKYIESWIDMRFDDEALAAALDRTITNTGSLKWPYMNGILKSWHAQGLHELAAIEASDGKRRAQAKTTAEDPGEGSAEQYRRYWGDQA